MLMQLSCGCCKKPGICGRPLYGGTPLNSNSEVSGYTTNWQSYFSPSAYVTVYGYKAQITSSDYLGSSGGQYHYEVKMRPFRWLAGGGTDDNNFVSDMVISQDCQNRFTGPPSNGPASLSTLDLKPQSGWSFANVNGHITMVHASTGDQVDFLMQNEVPQIYIKLPAETYSNMTSSCVYYPRGTEYESVYKYQPLGLFVSVWTMPQRGSWIPSASQDFHIEGRLLTNWDRRDYGVFKPEPYLDSAGFTDAMYTNFPRIVSVELV